MQYSKNIPRTYIGIVYFNADHDGYALYVNNKYLGKDDQVDLATDVLARFSGNIINTYFLTFPEDWDRDIPDHLGDVEVDDA